MYTVYGIPNCDVTKKVLQWLKQNEIEFEFHDYKTKNITAAKLKEWCMQLGWESILNKRSTTWRDLDTAVQEKINNEKAAIQLMMQQTSIIKRPVIELNKTVVAIGFDEKKYQKIFIV